MYDSVRQFTLRFIKKKQRELIQGPLNLEKFKSSISALSSIVNYILSRICKLLTLFSNCRHFIGATCNVNGFL